MRPRACALHTDCAALRCVVRVEFSTLFGRFCNLNGALNIRVCIKRRASEQTPFQGAHPVPLAPARLVPFRTPVCHLEAFLYEEFHHIFPSTSTRGVIRLSVCQIYLSMLYAIGLSASTSPCFSALHFVLGEKETLFKEQS